MTKEEILELMDIDQGADFKYFESLADLFETDEDYSSDELFEVLREVDTDLLSGNALGHLCLFLSGPGLYLSDFRGPGRPG